MKKLLLTLFLTVATSGVALAVNFGPSNFDVFGYPEPKCYEPSAPYSNDSWAWEHFKGEVESYRMCIEKYVEAAKNDIDDITERSNGAIRKYNMFINSIR